MKLWKLLPIALLSCGKPVPQSTDLTPIVVDTTPPVASVTPASQVLIVPTASPEGIWSLHFSPAGAGGGCEDAIVLFIGNAKQSVHLMAYGFTEEKVANALIAKKANTHLADGGVVDVKVVLDRSDRTAKGSMAPILKNGNVPVWIDSKHAIMHDKLVIVDGMAFETGSYNFTESAERKNAENCLIEYDKAKAGLYEDNFQVHLAHSDPLPYPN